MGRMARNVFVASFVAFFSLASTQLPPDIMADRYLIEAEQLLAKEDQAGAFEVMQRIVALQEEHKFTLPDEFHIKYARIALSVDSIKIANVAVGKYLLTAGRDGEFYKEALALSLKTELPVINANETCDGKPEGASCWMAFTKPGGCYLWIASYRTDAIATWSGACPGNVAHGNGTIIWAVAEEDTLLTYATSTGRMLKGRTQGKWVVKSRDIVSEGPMENGLRHGDWVERGSEWEGTGREPRLGKYSGEYVSNGQYVLDKKQGIWTTKWADACSALGPFMDGKMHGEWAFTCNDGNPAAHGPYVNGKMDGKWTEYSGGYVSTGPYVEGRKHGEWIEKSPYSSTSQGPYVNGKKHGVWTTQTFDRDDNKDEAILVRKSYVDGKKHGQYYHRLEVNFHRLELPAYLSRYRSNYTTLTEGTYFNDTKHGQWVTRFSSGYQRRQEYEYGKQDGIWYNCTGSMTREDECYKCLRTEYRLGEKIKEKKVNKKHCRQ